nr:saccharopine dehydrogenase [nad(+), l-lysine-forming] [Quercus suber]
MSTTVIHVRAETKPLEHRTAITPTVAKKLVDDGYTVNVEKAPLSIFKDEEYEGTGASLVPTGSWVDVPADHIIVGLKELPEEEFPLKHTHAGFAGAALALLAWAWQLKHGKDKPLPGVSAYENETALLKDVKTAVEEGKAQAGHYPRVLVIGALGRCGKGAVDLCIKAGLQNILIPPFVSKESLASSRRKLAVVCDVSCDTTNPHNPIPIYEINTTFDKPTVPVELPAGSGDLPLTVISIDHLPSLLPREASEAFSSQLLPSLLSLKDRKKTRVWQQAEKLFHDKVGTLPK